MITLDAEQLHLYKTMRRVGNGVRSSLHYARNAKPGAYGRGYLLMQCQRTIDRWNTVKVKRHV